MNVCLVVRCSHFLFIAVVLSKVIIIVYTVVSLVHIVQCDSRLTFLFSLFIS